MPKPKPVEWPLKQREDYFVTLYLRKGASPKFVSHCEKSAQLPPGRGEAILKLKWAKERVLRETQPIRDEQLRQRNLTDAAAIAKVQQQTELTSNVRKLRFESTDRAIITDRLMGMIVGLDMHRSPRELLDSIKVGYVVDGLLRADRLERVTPTEDTPSQNASKGIYQSLFERKSQSTPPTIEGSPAATEAQETAWGGQDGVFDLYPKPAIPEPKPEPPAEPEPEKKSNPPVITIQVG